MSQPEYSKVTQEWGIRYKLTTLNHTMLEVARNREEAENSARAVRDIVGYPDAHVVTRWVAETEWSPLS